MKRQLYDLTDEPFLMFVNRVGNVLREEGIKHNLVGGVSVQSYLLNMLISKHGGDVCELVSNPKVRIQDYLRSTDDVDLALRLEEESDTDKIKRINVILSKLSFEDVAPCQESIIEIRNERIGASRPTFRVYVDDKGSEEDVVAMNITRAKEGSIKNLNDAWYDILIDNSKELTIPYTSNYSLKVNVPSLEHLIAVKIANSRAKDLMDNKNLADLSGEAGIKIDFDEIKRVLLPDNEKNYHRFLEMQYPEKLRNKYH